MTIIGPGLLEGVAEAGIDLSNTWVTDDDGLRKWLTVDFNHHNSGVLGLPYVYLMITTYRYHEIDGLSNKVEWHFVDVPDLSDYRYRARLVSGDQKSGGGLVSTPGTWSPWRGGPVVKTQKDSWYYLKGGAWGTGTLQGQFQIQIEEYATSGIVLDTTLTLTLTVNP